MAEEKKTKTAKKSTAKKPAAKKTTAKKKPEEVSAPQLAETKKFEMTTPIRVRSFRQYDLIYKSTNGFIYTWNGYGDIRELPYQDVMSLKSRHSKFLYEPWLIIEDDDLLATKEFAGEFDELYALYAAFEDPQTFFHRKPSEIKEQLKDAPRGLRDLIIYNAGKYIEDGTLDSIGVINAVDEALGTQLKMLL